MVGSNEDNSREWIIRGFRPEDLAACRTLYRQGLIGGKIAENDTGLDIDDIGSAYMQSDGNQFWVAQMVNADGTPGPVVGMIGVQHDQGTGEIRRLRVAEGYRRRGIGSALVETAVKFCRDRDYLKVTLDTFMEREPALKLFDKFRFRHNRTRTFAGKDLLYFYLDLYTGQPRPHKEDEGFTGADI